ncbi:MAG: hypothetical protein IJM83_03090 [Firmicutes bacterium]|nr:hypothetical protein [Bacillota bacterium]
MKKTLALVLAVLLIIGMLSGCTKKEETPTGGETSGQAETTEAGGPETWKTISDIQKVEGLYENEKAHFENLFVYAFTVDGVIYRAIVNLTQEQSDALWALDIFDENYDQQEAEIIGSTPISQLENLTERIPSQSDLNTAWVGKTGEELLDAGWTVGGWNLLEKQFYLDYEFFEYSVIMEGDLQVNENDDIDAEEAIKPLKVKTIEFFSLRDATWDLMPQEEEWAEPEEGEGEYLAGGWMNEDMYYSMPSYELDPAAFKPMEKASETLMGVDYEPLALLGRQIVAGTNYAYLCKATVVAPGAESYLAVVFVYEALDGQVEVLNIVPIDVAAGNEEGDITVMAFDPQGSNMLGSWSVDPVNMQAKEAGLRLTDEEKDTLTQLEDVFKSCEAAVNSEHVAMYCLANQLVSGTNYCYLVMESETEFVLDYIYVDLQGNVELTGMRYFDYPLLIYVGQE